MNEPVNHTALIDRVGDTWVRVDEAPGRHGNWWPLTDGPGWDASARDGVGTPRSWPSMQEYGTFVEADPERSARALATVRRWAGVA